MICSIDGCAKSASKRGWCEMHYCRWRANGDPTVTRSGAWAETVEERLARNSRLSAGGCVEWIAARDKNGYGKFSKRGWPDRAHRAAWTAAFGPIPVGMLIRHKCDNPPCVSLDHLEIGDALANAADRVQRQRFNGSSTRYNKVRLSLKAAREIRAKHANGVAPRDLSIEYGVGRDQISRVINHRNWKETA